MAAAERLRLGLRPPGTLTTSIIPTSAAAAQSTLSPPSEPAHDMILTHEDSMRAPSDLLSSSSLGMAAAEPMAIRTASSSSSTGKGILIGMLSAFGAGALVALILLIIWFFQYTQRGRIFLDRLGRPGEYDDEAAFAREEAEALEEMDDMQRMEYMRAKAFVQANPPESVQTDISLSQFLAIQEKGVSAWEFEPELEIANCFVEGRTEIEFFDSECSVQSNLPIPKQNEVYYWEAKIYDKPENTLISIGMSTKPYPLFRLPGWHKHSIAYTSTGARRHNQPFTPVPYGPTYFQGDVIGVGYRPRTGTVFFTRNGKKLEDVAHGLKTQNFFPTVGANGPCQVHVNFGQLGFVFIEANVKKWGLAPLTGSLAPPPPYGSEQGSILLEGGRDGVREGGGGSYMNAGSGYAHAHGHARSHSQTIRHGLSRNQQPTSPGPQRSPTDISLAQLSLVDESDADDYSALGAGEGSSAQAAASAALLHQLPFEQAPRGPSPALAIGVGAPAHDMHDDPPPPEYESPKASPADERGTRLGHYAPPPPPREAPPPVSRKSSSDDADEEDEEEALERAGLLARSGSDHRQRRRERGRRRGRSNSGQDSPPIPSYSDAVAATPPRRSEEGYR